MTSPNAEFESLLPDEARLALLLAAGVGGAMMLSKVVAAAVITASWNTVLLNTNAGLLGRSDWRTD
ncbi:hypothetical protein CEY04_00660 [Achromobacter sp. HZ28]|nr:hypothetical protein CEY05_00660 [Achromobacter sp. HZ34]OWT81859.1 hypothetical protein CEY04_00660 [Achromobacter sp. HZ28]